MCRLYADKGKKKLEFVDFCVDLTQRGGAGGEHTMREENLERQLIDEVDETIKSVCAKIREEKLASPMEYAVEVKGLTALIEARAKLYEHYSFFGD